MCEVKDEELINGIIESCGELDEYGCEYGFFIKKKDKRYFLGITDPHEYFIKEVKNE